MRPTHLALVLLVLLTQRASAGPWRFEGQVTESDGRPIAGATVRAFRNGDREGFLPPSSEAAAVGTTDVAGRYVVQADEVDGGPAVRNMVVVVSTPDRARREQWIERAALDEGERIRIHPVALWRYELRQPPAGLDQAPRSALRVRLLRGDRPVAGLPVRGLVDGFHVGEAVSGNEGHCELSLPAAATHVVIQSSRHSPEPGQPRWSFVAPRGAGAVLVVQLPPLDATVQGEVAFAPAREPELALFARLAFTAEVDGGQLAVWRDLPRKGPYELPLPTGARGTLRLSPWATARGCGNGYVPRAAFDLRRPVEAGQTDASFQVPCGIVHGRVLGPTGLERGLVQVEATLADGSTLALETSHHGEFYLQGVPPGLVRIAARDGLDRGETTVLMTPGARVEAVVNTP